MRTPPPLRIAAIWIALCAYLNCAGWVLSAAHQLNAAGYAVSVGLGVVVLLSFLLRSEGGVFIRWSKLKWRSRRPLSLIFLITALLIFIGGAIYPPNNFDALVYRFPRILHWLAADQWHWISTPERRLNLAAVGFEWLMAPFLALTHSDRGFFLINFIPFLLMPSLIYSNFIRLGISKRVAWYWMWLIPSGYCFVLQAGSIGNDSFAGIYLLSALCFGLRARETGNIADVSISILSAALLTGAKASNIPLLLPCTIALIPSIRLILRKPLWITVLIPFAVLASFLPIAAANAYYTGDWTGDPNNFSKMKLDSPLYGVIGNAFQLLVCNAQPPVMPFAGVWNELYPKLLRDHFSQLLLNFPQLGLRMGELPTEELSGVGLGISGLALLPVVASLGSLFRKRQDRNRRGSILGGCICLGGFIALGAVMAKFGNEGVGRLIAPYYPMIIAGVLLLPSNRFLVQKRWWKWAAVMVALTGVSCVLLTPSRPLFPAQTLFSGFSATHPQGHLIGRAQEVYSAYAKRADALAPLRKYLPENEKVIGFIGADESEVSLWRPFGQRQVVDVSRSTKPQLLPPIIVTSNMSLQDQFGVSVEDWVKFHQGVVLGHENFRTKINRGYQDWYVIGLHGR